MKIISILSLVASLCLVGCKNTHIEQIDAETFLSYSNHIGMAYSITAAEFIGTSQDKAYLEYKVWWNANPKTYIYWIYLTDLPVTEAQKMKTHQHPWIPYDHSKVRPKPQNIDWKTADLFVEPTN